MSFTLELISVTIWPMLILVTLLMFRQPLIEVARSLSRVRFRDFELNFEQRSRDALIHASGTERRENGQRNQALEAIADDPMQAVALVWQELDPSLQSEELKRLYRDFNAHPASVTPLAASYFVAACLAQK